MSLAAMIAVGVSAFIIGLVIGYFWGLGRYLRGEDQP